MHRPFLQNATAIWRTTTARQVHPDPKDPQGLTALQETSDHLEKWVRTPETFRPCTRTPAAHTAPPVRWDRQEHPANSVHAGNGDRVAPRARQETMELQDTTESWDHVDRLGHPDRLEHSEDVEWIRYERRESEDRKEHQDQSEPSGWKGRGGIVEDWESMDRWDLLEFKEFLEELDRVECQGRLGSLVRMDRMLCTARVQNESPMELEAVSINHTSNNLCYLFVCIYRNKQARRITVEFTVW